MTIRCQVVAKEQDLLGYQTLVVKNLEDNSLLHSYCMIVVFPNWQSVIPEIGDKGFLEYEDVKAGDEYYSRKFGTVMKYEYTNRIFIKFVLEVDNSKKDIII